MRGAPKTIVLLVLLMLLQTQLNCVAVHFCFTAFIGFVCDDQNSRCVVQGKSFSVSTVETPLHPNSSPNKMENVHLCVKFSVLVKRAGWIDTIVQQDPKERKDVC